jgi:hypothetical protein
LHKQQASIIFYFILLVFWCRLSKNQTSAATNYPFKLLLKTVKNMSPTGAGYRVMITSTESSPDTSRDG